MNRRMPFETEIIDTEDGPMDIETSLLGNGFGIKITTGLDGTVESVVLIAEKPHEDGATESHTVEVSHPESVKPEILIDDVLSNGTDVFTAEAMFNHAKEIIEGTTDPALEPDTDSALKPEIDKTHIAEGEKTPLVENGVADSGEEALAPTEETLASVDEVPKEVPTPTIKTQTWQAHRPAQPSVERVRPAFDSEQARRVATSFVEDYGTNPIIVELLVKNGIDISDIQKRAESNQINVTPDNYATIRRLMDEVNTRSPLWGTAEGNLSQLQRTANEARKQILEVLRSL